MSWLLVLPGTLRTDCLAWVNAVNRKLHCSYTESRTFPAQWVSELSLASSGLIDMKNTYLPEELVLGCPHFGVHNDCLRNFCRPLGSTPNNFILQVLGEGQGLAHRVLILQATTYLANGGCLCVSPAVTSTSHPAVFILDHSILFHPMPSGLYFSGYIIIIYHGFIVSQFV